MSKHISATERGGLLRHFLRQKDGAMAVEDFCTAVLNIYFENVFRPAECGFCANLLERLMLRLYVTASGALSKLKADTSGAAAIEYALIASSIALAILPAIGQIGDELAALFNDLFGVPRCVEVGSNCKK